MTNIEALKVIAENMGIDVSACTTNVEVMNAISGDSTPFTNPEAISKLMSIVGGTVQNVEWVDTPSSGEFTMKKNVRKIVIPANVTFTNTAAFEDYVALEKIELPDNFVAFGVGTFRGCSSLRTINIPPLLKNTIQLGVFQGCTSLESCVLPEGITKIDGNAFKECSSLKEIVLSDNITSIGNYAFQNCTMLSRLVLPSKLTEIKMNAFDGCSGLKKIEIPNSVKSIAANAFSNCYGITDIYVPWSEDEVANAPWGATNATIHYNYTGE